MAGNDDLEDKIQWADEFKVEIYSADVKGSVLPSPTSRVASLSDSQIKLPKLTIPPFEGDVTK